MSWLSRFAIGRPRAIEGEKMAIADGNMASMVRPGQGGAYFLPMDEIIRRHGWKTYNEMRHDDQVKAALAFKRILIRGRAWEFAPADKSDQAKQVADFVTWCMYRVDLNNAFEEALSALEYGYALAEKVFERTDYQGKQVVCLKKIAFRDPQTLKLKSDVHGNFLGVRQETLAMGITPVELDPDKVWLWTYNGRFGNLYGDSDLRPAYRSWWAKKFIINFWNVFLERMGQPMMKMTYPLGASEELKNTLKQIMTNLASKTEILVPQGVEIELIEAMRGGTATYEQALEFHNNSIARAILMNLLLSNDKGTSSESQSFLSLRILFKMADEIAKAMVCSLMKQVVYQLVEFNFDGDVDALMPKFLWQDYGQFEGMKIADTIRLLHAAGILDMDQKDVNYARSILGMPLRGPEDEQDEVLRPPPPPPPGSANAPPPPAEQGNARAQKGGDTTTKNSEAPIINVTLTSPPIELKIDEAINPE